MCGIVGVLSARPLGDVGLVERMRDELRHRGPDSAGLWCSPDGCTMLGHRRLAIIDLSAAGHQPMTRDDGRLSITFNGEIYNFQDVRAELEEKGYRFRSTSDTEVVLEAFRAWGEGAIDRLNGMFAFGLYDVAARRLLLVRDRAGEKPLYYFHAPGRFMFASELKALMVDPTFPREVDLEALDFYLAYGYVPGERCLLKGVRKLAPGTLGVYDLARDRFHTRRYWDLPEPEPGSNADPEELTGELERLLEDAVRRQTVADVPVGVLLSGGLDSSLVTAMAARISSFPLKTYTVSFPGHGAYDEAQHARLVASHFDAKHTELVAEPATIDLLPRLARQYDEPLADSSMIPTYLVSRLIRQEATVALGGDGGDELFGGYSLYSWVLRQRWVRDRIPGPVQDAVAKLARRLPVGVRGRTYLLSLPMSQADAVARTGLYFDYDTRRALVPALRAIRPPSPELHRVACVAVGKTTIQQLTAADFRTYLPDDILVKVDRASMLASLEVRAPFLDHRIITFAFGHVPDRFRATLSERKILPRRLARRLLPQGLDLHRKQGFSIPMSSWLKGNWGPFFESVLMNIDSLFHAPTIHTLFLNQQRGLSNSQRLFALVMFELWRREYRIAC